MAYLKFSSQIGNGPSHLENPTVAAGRESQPVGHHLQQLLPLVVHGTEFSDMARLHLAVGMQPELVEPLTLDVSRRLNPGSNDGGGLPVTRGREVAVRNAGDVNMQVDPVEQRS